MMRMRQGILMMRMRQGTLMMRMRQGTLMFYSTPSSSNRVRLSVLRPLIECCLFWACAWQGVWDLQLCCLPL